MDDLFDVQVDVLYTAQHEQLPGLYQLLATACREFDLDDALPDVPEAAQNVWFHLVRSSEGELGS